MRDRAWRRYKEETIVIRRLNLRVSYNRWFYFRDINDKNIQHALLKDYINTSTCNMLKTYTTSEYDSRYKIKYSPNRSIGYNRDRNKKSTREDDRLTFLKILKENGIK